jgi:hypothetical protein
MPEPQIASSKLTLYSLQIFSAHALVSQRHAASTENASHFLWMRAAYTVVSQRHATSTENASHFLWMRAAPYINRNEIPGRK